MEIVMNSEDWKTGLDGGKFECIQMGKWNGKFLLDSICLWQALLSKGFLQQVIDLIET